LVHQVAPQCWVSESLQLVEDVRHMESTCFTSSVVGAASGINLSLKETPCDRMSRHAMFSTLTSNVHVFRLPAQLGKAGKDTCCGVVLAIASVASMPGTLCSMFGLYCTSTRTNTVSTRDTQLCIRLIAGFLIVATSSENPCHLSTAMLLANADIHLLRACSYIAHHADRKLLLLCRRDGHNLQPSFACT
jgi:hypothetical protein